MKQLLESNLNSEAIQVFYLPKKLRKGPKDGSAPVPASLPLKSVNLIAQENTNEQEQKLSIVPYRHPEGDIEVCKANNSEWYKALKPLLIDKETAISITGGES